MAKFAEKGAASPPRAHQPIAAGTRRNRGKSPTPISLVGQQHGLCFRTDDYIIVASTAVVPRVSDRAGSRLPLDHHGRIAFIDAFPARSIARLADVDAKRTNPIAGSCFSISH